MSQSSSSSSNSKSANTLWGGRFSAGPAEIMEKINVSIGFDQRMWQQDIEGSRAHLAMLVAQGIVSGEDGEAIAKGLDQVERELAEGRFDFKAALEDIHMNVEARMTEIVGPAGGRLHTARSRNDQVATDFRLWVRNAADEVDAALTDLLAALIDQAEAHADVVMPGFTHLQSAQPVTFGHHMMAYAEMIQRDRGRFRDARKRMNESPLGAAALAGTSFPIDREATAKALGFDRPMRNSMDAVADRDHALEFLAAATICAVHLSRFAEEIVLWMTAQFRFVTLTDAFTTGSSIMPQKRNPDAAELVRAKPGRVLGAFTSLATMMKGLPLTYSKDMQEDKEPTFEAADSLMLAIAATTGMVRDLKPNRDKLAEAAGAGFSTATDLADWVVRVLGLPFRQAHHITGALVKMAEDKGCDLADLSLEEMQSVEAGITADIYRVLTPEASVTSRTSFGGTAPDNVRAAAAQARKDWL
ncbi:MAG: argininosuccinate lyase [Alphaproteobacteria bacterium]|nr:argininosuccinate lyase [Alphaproteobacteria bacterium]